jgi:hypothetical protein
MFVTPCFVLALRIATKFFQRATDPHGIVTETDKQPGSSAKTSSAYDSVMNRVEAATTTNSNDEQKERLNRMNDALQTWMEAVKRFAPRKHSTKNEEPGTQSTDNEERDKISVPYACFLYLWDLQQEHSRVAVRRAALFLSGLLLQKSKDCRFHLDQDANLSSWISSIVAEGFTWKNPEQAAKQLPLLQREASMLLSYLVDQGYAKLYPKIGVAALRIRQQCPNLGASDPSTISNMSDWRRLRDIALTHGEEEIRRVQKLVDRSHACLEILVPRVGQTPASIHKGEEVKDEAAEEDEDDIDWEDGDDFEDGSSFMSSNMEHLVAVERTLAVMESTGGLRGGEMEVDFGKSDDTDDVENTQQNPKTLTTFKKCVKLLAVRHMTRLSMWLDGLTNADNLVIDSSSLVSLPSDVAHLRNNLVERLSDLKRTISSILSSASRLSVETVEAGNPSSSASSTHVVAPRLCDNSGRNSLVSAMQRQKHGKSKSSNRIQIKCRSS